MWLFLSLGGGQSLAMTQQVDQSFLMQETVPLKRESIQSYFPSAEEGSSVRDRCVCNKCGKRLRNSETLWRHVRQMHIQPLHAAWCRICNKVYRTKNSLWVHQSRYHRKEKRPQQLAFQME